MSCRVIGPSREQTRGAVSVNVEGGHSISHPDPGRAFRRLLAIAALLIASMVSGACSASAAEAVTTTVAVNGASIGRTFDWVGAISGGGNSRLLIDYPPAQRAQILDYLFKPNYGAAVQLLKLEIGGDANSTDGAEPSHQHVRGEINCDVGYEFWLGKEAVARNPNIKLVALPWAAPGWIGNGNFWTQDMIDYDISWLDCAKGHGLTISYLGGWNERSHDKTLYKNLRSALNARGYASVQIVGDDSGWDTADDMLADPAFNNAVGVVGSHYPCGYLSDATSCASSANAVATGKPLWASEFGSQDYNSGSVPYIRSITRGYLDGQMTGFMNWPLVAALYPNLPYATVALAVAGSPWSGSYQLGKNLWANAQVAQFTQPGWKFLTGSASGYLGGNRANGSYISLKFTNGTDYSTVYETTGTAAAQTVNVSVASRAPQRSSPERSRARRPQSLPRTYGASWQRRGKRPGGDEQIQRAQWCRSHGHERCAGRVGRRRRRAELGVRDGSDGCSHRAVPRGGSLGHPVRLRSISRCCLR
ncbi:hypothetical protein [Umezawaea sp. Da 62-37]|uniref:hypothetical protein n=1 Tax=Umezawaea sp. Da 62-37 TaxID=3075927 RepID=UPI0028F71458|nr:hypothetical protein [Umezawaea sp. Da 62-37]WNV82958.1 hypothetical protein RM788_32830 [Umezawaea sp. Da 62-37]